jgi:hypothetical protein
VNPCPKDANIDHDAVRRGEQGAIPGGIWDMEDERFELFHCPTCRSTLGRAIPPLAKVAA